jgi:hypothetical protein
VHITLLRKGNARSELRLGAAKRLIPHEQRRKRIGGASSKLDNVAFYPHARLPRHEQVAYHIRSTNEPWKKTHPLNVELISSQMSGKDSDPDFSIPKQAKAEYGKLQ